MHNSKSFWHKLPAIVTAGYFIALVTGTHWPRANFNFGFEITDKMMHTAAYAGLAALCRLTWLTWPSLAKNNRTAIFFAIMLCSMGAIDELTQIPVPGRTGSIYDWIADVVGVAGGLAFYQVTLPLIRRFYDWADRSSGATSLATQ